MTNYEKIAKLITENQGYITRKDIDREAIPSWLFTDYVRKHNLVKIEKGFYALQNWFVDPFLVFQYKYPRFIYSFDSASYLLNMSDIIPAYLEVTGPKNYRPYPKKREGIIAHTDTRDVTYFLEIIMVTDSFGYKVKCYSPEKTVCDYIRNREDISSEHFKKVVNAFIRRKDKNLNKLIDIAKTMKILKKVQEILEVIDNE